MRAVTDFDDPVVRYWPTFNAQIPEKERVTIMQGVTVLSVVIAYELVRRFSLVQQQRRVGGAHQHLGDGRRAGHLAQKCRGKRTWTVAGKRRQERAWTIHSAPAAAC